MAAKHYLAIIAGRITEVIATIISAGAGDDGKIVALDGTGRLDPSVMPVGISADTKSIATTEDLAAGNYVNIYDATGFKCRKADASAIGTMAHGYVLAATLSGANATVYFDGANNQLSGLAPGTFWLSETAGAVTQTPPTTTGAIVQSLGNAKSATEGTTEIGDPVILA